MGACGALGSSSRPPPGSLPCSRRSLCLFLSQVLGEAASCGVSGYAECVWGLIPSFWLVGGGGQEQRDLSRPSRGEAEVQGGRVGVVCGGTHPPPCTLPTTCLSLDVLATPALLCSHGSHGGFGPVPASTLLQSSVPWASQRPIIFCPLHWGPHQCERPQQPSKQLDPFPKLRVFGAEGYKSVTAAPRLSRLYLVCHPGANPDFPLLYPHVGCPHVPLPPPPEVTPHPARRLLGPSLPLTQPKKVALGWDRAVGTGLGRGPLFREEGGGSAVRGRGGWE